VPIFHVTLQNGTVKTDSPVRPLRWQLTARAVMIYCFAGSPNTGAKPYLRRFKNSSWKMISRRNIRIKVMQTLYTSGTLEINPGPGEPQKILLKHFEETSDLFFYLVYYLIELAHYAETDAAVRAGKHLPNYQDLHVNIKIAGNEVLQKMEEDVSLKQQFTKRKPGYRMDRELLRRIYGQLTATAQYKQYISSPERDKKEEKDILEFIFNDLMLANEIFLAHIEENFSNWEDDGEMVIQLLVGNLQKPTPGIYSEMISAEKLAFAKNLLRTVLEKTEHLQHVIVPKLKNWDPERIALLDMILMKMGVAEFLYFETIPPKVTINEYIDLAKEYSTAQSGQFVNGILDNIHKELVLEGKMHKVDFKKA
jgi:N utilization substance protein B